MAAQLERSAQRPLTPSLRHIRDVCRYVALNGLVHPDDGGHADVRPTPVGATSWINSTEAGEALRISPRHCRRLAEDGSLLAARKIRGRWKFDANEIAALAKERRSA
ncbi:helix-turn-helix domain-containing protein [Nocardioides marmorisolisilvae]|uniref:helix-turn-helix domain-containing protein n=1 Tax=Nocardioides marmorisolisilvae TaxID=1542737 RepID=UPI0011CE8394|nr:helix-turn-helix domain-containing protein [Nocardioides marmorisolisilvae]